MFFFVGSKLAAPFWISSVRCDANWRTSRTYISIASAHDTKHDIYAQLLNRDVIGDRRRAEKRQNIFALLFYVIATVMMKSENVVLASAEKLLWHRAIWTSPWTLSFGRDVFVWQHVHPGVSFFFLLLFFFSSLVTPCMRLGKRELSSSKSKCLITSSLQDVGRWFEQSFFVSFLQSANDDADSDEEEFSPMTQWEASAESERSEHEHATNCFPSFSIIQIIMYECVLYSGRRHSTN